MTSELLVTENGRAGRSPPCGTAWTEWAGSRTDAPDGSGLSGADDFGN